MDFFIFKGDERIMLFFRLHKWLYGAFIALAVFCSAGMDIHAQSAAYHDEKIKSVFIYNLTHFASWPAMPGSNPPSHFCICLLGENRFKDDLDNVVENESVDGLPIVVNRANDLAEFDLDCCQMLFIDEQFVDRLSDILSQTRDKSILVIGDSPRFADNGGMVNLMREKKRIKIEINTTAVKQTGVKLNAKLLQLARIVDQPSSSGDE